jgi:hypothetical protein
VASATLIKKQVHVWQNCHKKKEFVFCDSDLFLPEMVEHPQIKQVRVTEQPLAPDTIVLPTQLSDWLQLMTTILNYLNPRLMKIQIICYLT